MVWKQCETCKGDKTVPKEISPGRWESVPCPACNGAGGTHTGAI